MRDKSPDALSYSHTNGGGRVVLVLVAPMSHLLVDKRIRVILAECDGQGSAGEARETMGVCICNTYGNIQ